MNKNLIKIFSVGLITALLFTGCTNNSNQKSLQEKESNEQAINVNEENNVSDESNAKDEIEWENLKIKPSFLSVEEGAKALAKEDTYIKNLSKFDYASKFKSDKVLNEEERYDFYKSKVLEFTEEEKGKIGKAMVLINDRIGDLGFNLPDTVKFIKTDGSEEGGAAYTRDENIVFPPSFLEFDQRSFEQIVAHELFHVYSRYNTPSRPDIYKIIGFEAADGLVYPDSIKDLVISNPDAPDVRYYVKDTYMDKEMLFIPIIYSNEEYDLEKNKSFFETMELKMMAVELKDGILEPLLNDGQVLLVNLHDLPNVFKNTGENTDYVIHPEEIIADNFALFVVEGQAKSQWVIDELIETMKEIK